MVPPTGFEVAYVDPDGDEVWLLWPEGGRVRSHAPDFFARKADGTGVVSVAEPLDGG